MNTTRLLAIASVFLAISGCSANGQERDREEMLIKASALTKVAKAVASAVEFRDAPPTLSEAELLRFATQHDPEMLEPFRDYLLRARRQGTATSVLMCTKDGQTGLLEDTACSARSDAHLWERVPPVSCAFQLDIAQACAR